MGISLEAAPDFDEGERVIDRSGDIDQRPLEERTRGELVNIPPLQAAVQPGADGQFQRYDPPSPPSPRPQPAANPAELALRLQKDLDKQFAKAKTLLETLSQKIEAQEKRCLPPKIDDDLQQIRFQRQKVLIANGPVLADCLREERSRLADLESFKKESRLTRDAHYPASPVLAFGILSILILVEAAINGVLFADSSDQGLFGGWLEALVLSITNVGAAFLLGRIVFPQLHRRGLFARTGAIILSLAGLFAVAAVNLSGAHYRDFKAGEANFELTLRPQSAPKHEATTVLLGSKPAAARKMTKVKDAHAAPPQQAETAGKEKFKEREAIRKVLDAPLAFDSFMSFFLFVTGLCGACIAALDGYKFDDPFPGYGKRHRRYAGARLKSTEALRRILNQSNGIMTGSFQAISRKIETFSHEMAGLFTLHLAYAGEYKAATDSLEEAARDAEAQIACYSRMVKKVPDRETRDFYTVAVKRLPPLSEKQVKFYESQDKKLKALRKMAQKEQSDVLGVFDAATADFQKLLADASQASLRAALVSPPQNPSGQSA